MRWRPFLIIFALILPISWRWLYIKGKVPVNGNVLREVYPNWKVTQAPLRAGQIPLWNPYRNMGEPLLADPKTMAAYPIRWFLTPASTFLRFFQGWILIHTLLAACFGYLLSLHWYRHRPAACATAVLLGWNGFFMAHAPYPNLFASAAWVPAIVYAHSRRSWPGLGVTLALQWLAGYPPFSALTLGLLLLLTWGRDRALWKCLGMGVITAAGLAAYQGLPFLEMLRHSTRSLILDTASVLKFSLTPQELMKELFFPQWIWWSPTLHGDPAVMNLYVGVLAVPLAVWAAWKGAPQERRLAGLTSFALLFCLGATCPGYQWMTILHFFRFPATWLLLVAFGLSLLAGAGIARIQNPKMAWVVVGMITLDLLLFAQTPTAAWFPPAFLEEPAARMASLSRYPFPTRLYHSPLAEEYRVGESLLTEKDYWQFKEDLSPSMAVGWKGHEVNSYQVLRLRRAQAYIDRIAQEGPASPRLSWAGVSTLMTLTSNLKQPDDKTLVAIDLPPPQPPVFFVEGDRAGQVTSVSSRPGHLKIGVRGFQVATLVFSEVNDGGWKLTVDDRRMRPEMFDETFLAARLTPGDHTVIWDYQPLSFRIGALISLLTAGALGLFLLYTQRSSS